MATVETEVHPPELNGKPIPVSTNDPATIRTFNGGGSYQPVPPDSWNPLKATDEELSFYGFPPRPSEPKELESWVNEFTNYTGVLSETPCLDATGIRHDINGDNWGGVVNTGHTDYTKTYVVVQQPPIQTGCATDRVYSTWTGLGGYGTRDLMQNGQDDGVNVPMNATGADGHVAAWTEEITNGVDAGPAWVVPGFINRTNYFNMTTQWIPRIPGGTPIDQVEYWWHNTTTGHIVNLFHTSANGLAIGSSYDGSSADFIVERLGTGLGYDIAPAVDQVWSNAATIQGGNSIAVGDNPHTDLFTKGLHSGDKTEGLVGGFMQTSRSWTMHHFRCN